MNGELGSVFNRMVEGLLHLTKEIQGSRLARYNFNRKIVETARYQLEKAEEFMAWSKRRDLVSRMSRSCLNGYQQRPKLC